MIGIVNQDGQRLKRLFADSRAKKPRLVSHESGMFASTSSCYQ